MNARLHAGKQPDAAYRDFIAWIAGSVESTRRRDKLYAEVRVAHISGEVERADFERMRRICAASA